MATPPGVREEDFSKALAEFEAVIGSEWVFTSSADINLYRDSYSPFKNEEEELLASAALGPDTVEQVQEIVRISNRYNIPLYPVSTGRNLGYGGSAPVMSGSVVLDLKRLNRIIEVNEKNAYVLVEPGVSYFDLYRHIQEKGYKLWIDCPDPGWGSLVGNALDRGAGWTIEPFRDHYAAHCGMEVILPDGELMRTGMGALPAAKTWQQFQYGFGPFIDGLFSQSNFGIVTKMGFWLYPEPEAYLGGAVLVHQHDDVMPLVEILAELGNAGIMRASSSVTSPILSRVWSDPDLQHLFLNRDAAAIAQLNELARTEKRPFWRSYLQFYGPEEIVEASWRHAQKKFSSIPGVEFDQDLTLRFPLTQEETDAIVDKPHIGVPSLSVFGALARSERQPIPTAGHFGFSPVIPMTGEAIIDAQITLTRIMKESGAEPVISVYPQSFHPRAFVALCLLPVSDDIETNKRYREGFYKLIKVAAEKGWGEYRTHSAFMDQCAEVYSFNDNALMKFHEKIKDALDPKGILSAGRYGIWPKRLRDERG